MTKSGDKLTWATSGHYGILNMWVWSELATSPKENDLVYGHLCRFGYNKKTLGIKSFEPLTGSKYTEPECASGYLHNVLM